MAPGVGDWIAPGAAGAVGAAALPGSAVSWASAGSAIATAAAAASSRLVRIGRGVDLDLYGIRRDLVRLTGEEKHQAHQQEDQD